MTTSLRIAIILGIGLGQLISEITDSYSPSYQDVPNFPIPTVEGRAGNFIFGRLSGKDIMAMKNRLHFYGGYSMKDVTSPIRVVHELDIETLFASSASGGTSSSFKIGDFMTTTGHINMFPEHPLRGRSFPTDPRFPGIHEAYDYRLIDLADSIAKEENIEVQHGVYMGVQGPTLEIPAEYHTYHKMGGDAVGMSTVPEVVTAHHSGTKVFGISIITDLGGFDVSVRANHEEVREAADATQPRIVETMREMIKRS